MHGAEPLQPISPNHPLLPPPSSPDLTVFLLFFLTCAFFFFRDAPSFPECNNNGPPYYSMSNEESRNCANYFFAATVEFATGDDGFFVGYLFHFIWENVSLVPLKPWPTSSCPRPPPPPPPPRPCCGVPAGPIGTDRIRRPRVLTLNYRYFFLGGGKLKCVSQKNTYS